MVEDHIQKQFLETFDTYKDAIFRFCMVKTSRPDLSEDLTQETFMRYWQSLRSGKEMTNARAYLYTIAGNLVIDWYRRKKADSLDALAEGGFEAEDTKVLGTLDRGEANEILRVIEGLEEKDREVLLLRFVEGLEPRDIAAILDEPVNTISVRIHRAEAKVRTKLGV